MMSKTGLAVTDWLQSNYSWLTDEQKNVILWAVDNSPEERNAIVEAVAGSGKTSVLMVLVEAIVKFAGVISVGYIQFNRKNKIEVEAKIQKKGLQNQVEVKTSYSLGMTAVRNFLGSAGKLIKVYDRKYSNYAYNLVKQESRLNPSLTADFKAALSVLKNLCDKVRLELVDPRQPEEIWRVASHYGLSEKINSNWADWAIGTAIPKMMAEGMNAVFTGNKYGKREIDFVDMIWLPHVLKIPKHNFPQYFWLLVDEAQDLSLAQHNIVANTMSNGGRAVAVGDRHQAIYGFAGALHDSMDKLRNRFKPVRGFPLTYNFRSGAQILRTVQKIVPHIRAPAGSHSSKVEEIDYDDLSSSLLSGDLILSRVNAPLTGLFFKLIGNGVGATIVGNDFSRRLIHTMKKITELQGMSWDRFHYYTTQYSDQEYNKARAQMKGKGEPNMGNLGDILESLEIIVANNPECKSMKCFENLINGMFSEDADSTVVSLSSIHRAKGLEAERVFIMWTNPDDENKITLPHPMAVTDWEIIQELNLVYVSRTRAMKELYFINGFPMDVWEIFNQNPLQQLADTLNLKVPIEKMKGNGASSEKEVVVELSSEGGDVQKISPPYFDF